MTQERYMYSVVLVLLLFAITPLSAAAAADLNQNTTATSSTCPMDLSYVQTIPWDYSPCNSITTTDHAAAATTTTTKRMTQRLNLDETQMCCQTLTSLIGIGLALHLKKTSLFHLSDLPTAVSCLTDFQSHLSTLSPTLPPSLVSSCFPNPSRFVISPTTCAGIQNKDDWLRKLPESSSKSLFPCSSNVSNPTVCTACAAAGFMVSSQLSSLDGNASHSRNCFYFTVLYAAGVVNEMGPESPGASACILGLSSFPPLSKDHKHRERCSALVYASTGAGIAVFFMSSLAAGMYLWWVARRKKERENSLDVELGS